MNSATASLGNLIVLDASRILAGPYCGQLFADHGAEVIKIEPPEGDPNRRWPLQVAGMSTNFLSVNRNKKSMTINLRTTAGRSLFYDLVKRADVLIHNYLPETAEKLGIDDDRLEAANSNLVRIVLTGFGAHGELRNKPGYDTMITAYSGIMSLTGERDRPPVKPGVSAIDLAAGAHAYGAALTALLARTNGRAKGQRIDISLLETAVMMLGFHGLNWLLAGKLDQREGANYGPMVPFGCYRCGNGDIMIGVSTDIDWRRFCEAIGGDSLIEDPRYCSNDLRCRNDAELRVELEAILATRGVAEWVAILDTAHITNAPIQTIDQVFSDPQVLCNDMVVESRMASGQILKLLGLPFKMSATPADLGRAPPELGEHTDEVLTTLLGLAPAAIAALRAEKAI